MSSVPQPVRSALSERSVSAWPLEAKSRDGERSHGPIIHERTVSDLLPQLDVHRSLGLERIQPRVLREVVKGSPSHSPGWPGRNQSTAGWPM